MAESTTTATATPAATGGESPTPGTGAAVIAAHPEVAANIQTMDDWLDSKVPAGTAEAPKKDDAETGKPEDAEHSGEEEETDEGDDNGEGSVKSEVEIAAEAAAAEAEITGEGAAVILGQFEQGVLKTLREKGVPESLIKRTTGLFVKDIKNREALAKRDAIIVTKDAELTAAKAQLTEAASKATMAPAGPLAYLDSAEKLEAAAKQAAGYLRWLENPEDAERYFPEGKGGRTTEQQLQDWRAWALNVLENQTAQSNTLNKRQAAREKLKAAAPTLFTPEHADAKALAEFYADDPRTRADADEILRLYLKGKKIEEEETQGLAKYHRIDLKRARADGAKSGHANGNGAENTTNGRQSSIQLPTPKAATRVPVRREGKPLSEQLAERAKTTGVSWDDQLDAEREGLAVN